MKIFKTRQELLLSLPKNMKIAEVGVFKGELSKFIFKDLCPNELFLIDLFEGGTWSGDQNGENMQFANMSDQLEFLKKHFEKCENVKFLKGYSHSQLQNIPNEYLDLVYIDASHEYEDVKKDLSISFTKVKKHGFICGHDYEINRFPGVVKAVNEFCENLKLKIISLSEDKLPTYLITKYE